MKHTDGTGLAVAGFAVTLFGGMWALLALILSTDHSPLKAEFGCGIGIALAGIGMCLRAERRWP